MASDEKSEGAVSPLGDHLPGDADPRRRLTKIIATVGTPDTPSGNKEALRRLIDAGVSVFRLNFSHGSHEGLAETLRLIRELESECGIPAPGSALRAAAAAASVSKGPIEEPRRDVGGSQMPQDPPRGCYPIGVLGDLSGPKIRIGKVKPGGVEVAPGQDVVLQTDTIEATDRRFSTTWPQLINDVRIGERLLVNDGAIRMLAVEVRPDAGELICRVTVGGLITSGKGINLPNTNLRVGAITEKDWRDLAWAIEHGVDAIALSFVRRADEILTLKRRMRSMAKERGIRPLPVIAKIEKPEALRNIHEIMQATDGIMVARGDLGVEMDLAEVPMIQKRLIDLANAYGKPSIVATQMLESMINSPAPTRAEASDVANAILDGADAVMLSAETAVGRFPAVAVSTMGRIARFTEEYELEEWATSYAAGAGRDGALRRGRLPALRSGRGGTPLAEVNLVEGTPGGFGQVDSGSSADIVSGLGVGAEMTQAVATAGDSTSAVETGGRRGSAQTTSGGIGGMVGSGLAGRSVEVKYRHWMAALAAGTARIAQDVRAEAIVAWSQSGATALELSRCAFRVPVIICSDDPQTLRRITFLRGITPVQADPPESVHAFTELADRLLLERELVKPGAPIVLVAGHPIGSDQKTNSLAVHYVGDPQTGYRKS